MQVPLGKQPAEELHNLDEKLEENVGGGDVEVPGEVHGLVQHLVVAIGGGATDGRVRLKYQKFNAK